jgi:hypothetical protein
MTSLVARFRTGPASRADAGRLFLALMAFSLVLLVLVYQLPHATMVDVGSSADTRSIQGFYFSEEQAGSSVRWSGPIARVAFDGVGIRPWRLRLRASGLRPTGTAAVILAVNGQPLAQVNLAGDMREYEFAVPAALLGPSGNVVVTLQTATFTAPPDTRDLGIMVDWLRLEPDGTAPVIPPPLMLAGFVLAIALCFLAFVRLGGPVQAGLLGGLVLALPLAAGLAVDPLFVAHYGPWLLVALAALALAGQRARQATWWEWAALVVLGWSLYCFGVRALDFYRTGLPPGDFTIYFDAAKGLRLGQPLYNWEAARQIPNGPVYKYPPLFAMLLAPATVFAARPVAAGWYLLNLGLLGLILFALIWRFRRDLGTRSPKLVSAYSLLLVIGFLNFQPAWESLARGQMDVIILAGMVAALFLLRHRAGEAWAGGLLAFVTMLKLYPGLLVVYLLWRRRWRALAGFAVTFALLVILSGLVAGWGTLWRYVAEILTVQTAAVPWPENQSFDGFLGRLVIPAPATTWYTTIAFPRWALLALYLLDAVTLGVTAWAFAGRTDPRSERFVSGYAVAAPLIVLMWPTAWIHYQTLLILPFGLLLGRQLLAGRRDWLADLLLLVGFLLVAIGNEYQVLLPWLQAGLPRLAQSYKLCGVLILWGLYIWWGRKAIGDKQPYTARGSAGPV